MLKTNRELYFVYRLNGLKALGIDTFDIFLQINYLLHHPYWWGMSITNYNNNQPFLKKLYNEQLTAEEVNNVVQFLYDFVVDEIEQRIGYWEQNKQKNQ
ncbi:MAG: hypothetical protein U0V64_14700 [Cyclobacteriaceae bacterium]